MLLLLFVCSFVSSFFFSSSYKPSINNLLLFLQLPRAGAHPALHTALGAIRGVSGEDARGWVTFPDPDGGRKERRKELVYVRVCSWRRLVSDVTGFSTVGVLSPPPGCSHVRCLPTPLWSRPRSYARPCAGGDRGITCKCVLRCPREVIVLVFVSLMQI